MSVRISVNLLFIWFECLKASLIMLKHILLWQYCDADTHKKKHIHQSNIRRVVNMWSWKWFAVIQKKNKRKIKLIFSANLKIAHKSSHVNQWVLPRFLCLTFIVCYLIFDEFNTCILCMLWVYVFVEKIHFSTVYDLIESQSESLIRARHTHTQTYESPCKHFVYFPFFSHIVHKWKCGKFKAHRTHKLKACLSVSQS